MSTETDRLERQLDEDRAAIGQTIDAMKARLSPGELLDQALGYVRSGGAETGANLARSVRDNPVPFLLTGIGLTWLIASSASSSGGGRHDRSVEEHVARSNAAERARAEAAAAKRGEGESESQFQERLTDIKARALSVTRRAEETAASFRQRVEDALHQAETAAENMTARAKAAGRSGAGSIAERRDTIMARAHDAQHRITDFYHSQPLLGVVLGVAAGTLLSALLPPTRTEERLAGEYGGKAREQARKMAATAAGAAKAAASEGGRAAADAAEDELGFRSQTERNDASKSRTSSARHGSNR